MLVEDRTYAASFMHRGQAQGNSNNRAALRKVFTDLQAAGIGGLHYLAGDALLGADGDDTVDGSHPTDLGFKRQTDAFYPLLQEVLVGR